MAEKKFSNENIIDAIIFKFGNIEANGAVSSSIKNIGKE
jgi:hypothetical protein